MQREYVRVLVLGAGITGVCSAWFLAKAGYEVTVIDRQHEAGLETSFANGGQISVSQSEPWASPDAPWRVFKWLGQEDAPLLFRPRSDWRQWWWCLQFLNQCRPGAWRRNVQSMLALAQYSRCTLQALRNEIDLQYDQQTRGILQLYFSQASLDQASTTSELMREHGCLRETISAQRAIALEPALSSIGGRLHGAIYAPDDESGDAHQFTQGLACAAQSAGVRFLYQHAICAIEHAAGRISGVRVCDQDGRQQRLQADQYLLCLGSYSPQLVAPLGIYLPIYPAKGYSATMQVSAESCAPSLSITDNSHKMVFSRLGKRIRIAGTAELNGYCCELNEIRCQSLLKRYFELFPDSADPSSVQFWTGLRPATPGNVPIIGRSRIPNLFFNTGHGTLGWTEGAGSGRAIADIMGGHRPEPDFPFLGLT